MPGRGSRATSGPWSRLKPVEPDFLESVGLPSKGETRLLNLQFQQRYYTAIVERYLAVCTDAGERTALLERFASLNLQDKADRAAAPSAAPSSRPAGSASAAAGSRDTNLAAILLALRKLREGLVATQRTDAFAAQAYLFAIRLAVLTRQPEAYHPALQHLLRVIRPRYTTTTTTTAAAAAAAAPDNKHDTALSAAELREVVAYVVLDAACRRGALAEAYALRRHYGLRDAKVNAVLRALVADNWVLFWRVRESVDGHVAALMDMAVPAVRMHVLKACGRAYLGVGVEFLEQSTGSSWERLVEDDGVGWKLDGGRVVIRKVQAKTQ